MILCVLLCNFKAFLPNSQVPECKCIASAILSVGRKIRILCESCFFLKTHVCVILKQTNKTRSFLSLLMHWRAIFIIKFKSQHSDNLFLDRFKIHTQGPIDFTKIYPAFFYQSIPVKLFLSNNCCEEGIKKIIFQNLDTKLNIHFQVLTMNALTTKFCLDRFRIRVWKNLQK